MSEGDRDAFSMSDSNLTIAMPSRRSTVTMSSADGSGFSALASLEPEANLQLKQHPAPE